MLTLLPNILPHPDPTLFNTQGVITNSLYLKVTSQQLGADVEHRWGKLLKLYTTSFWYRHILTVMPGHLLTGAVRYTTESVASEYSDN